MNEKQLRKFIGWILYRTMDIWLGIWAVNTLFKTDIKYTFINCVAAYMVIGIVDSNPLRSKKELFD